ncbi:MAG: alpha/beta fold hydrolase [Rhodospirillaceae bacterium]|nr:alpha/beta fold hydrolase [Rhodospirillaceae bacterium]
MDLTRRDSLGLAAAMGFTLPAAAQTAPSASTGEQAMAARITRYFVTVGDRQVHYRRAGSGPALFLLHASPGSSLSMVGLINQLSDRFTVIAPDTPGNGLSEPLRMPEPVMADYADALAQLMTALGLRRAAVYGSYTGAGCALEMSRRHPDRVTQVVVNGYLQFTDAERAEILANYLPVFAPDWYGGHLIWAWARMREQIIFFPWFRKDDASRMAAEVPRPPGLHRGVVDLMRSGDNYRAPYRSAFAMDYAGALQAAKAPTVITTSRQDVMWPHLARMPQPPANVIVHGTETREASFAIAKDVLAAAPADGPAPPPAAVTPMPGRTWCETIDIDGGSAYLRRNTDARGRPIVFLHDTAGSSLASDETMAAFVGKRPVLAIDLPGNGESEATLGPAPTVEAQAAVVARVLDRLAYGSVDVVALGGGCAVAVELAAREPRRVNALVLRRVQCLDDAAIAEKVKELVPELEPRAHGAHLLSAWNFVRDRELFEPWYVRGPATALRGEDPDLDPVRVQARTLDLLKCADLHTALLRAHDGYPMARRLADLRCRVVLDRPGSPSTQRAATAASKAKVAVEDLPRLDPARFADRVLTLLA